MDITKLKDYLKRYPLQWKNSDTKTIMEELYWSYAESNPPVNEKIRDLYHEIDNCFAHLTIKESDAVFDAFSDICLEQEKLIFQGGVHIGMQLVLELMDKNHSPDEENSPSGL